MTTKPTVSFRKTEPTKVEVAQPATSTSTQAQSAAPVPTQQVDDDRATAASPEFLPPEETQPEQDSEETEESSLALPPMSTSSRELAIGGFTGEVAQQGFSARILRLAKGNSDAVKKGLAIPGDYVLGDTKLGQLIEIVPLMVTSYFTVHVDFNDPNAKEKLRQRQTMKWMTEIEAMKAGYPVYPGQKKAIKDGKYSDKLYEILSLVAVPDNAQEDLVLDGKRYAIARMMIKSSEYGSAIVPITNASFLQLFEVREGHRVPCLFKGVFKLSSVQVSSDFGIQMHVKTDRAGLTSDETVKAIKLYFNL